eukprot:PhM_4_TR14724/c0_g1_i1/m.78837
MPSHANILRSKKLADSRLREKITERQRRIAEFRKVAASEGFESTRLKELDEARAQLRDKKQATVESISAQEASANKKRRKQWHVEQRGQSEEWKVVLKDLGRGQAEKRRQQQQREAHAEELRRQREAEEAERQKKVAEEAKVKKARSARRQQMAQRTQRGQPIMNHRVARIMEKVVGSSRGPQ